ncbi:alpha/beta hydrolase [Clostridium sp. Marseille-P299]|uniref:alpha/beta hydrolase n=1 Tax=Clostridium sp. Marseille-P299 TaxID=1805477 RepID=UPI00082F0F35|nr:alpha/beta fold hydrolase [Clostridium sp. Marseille-P299]
MGLLITFIIIVLIVTIIIGAITWRLSNIILKPKVLSTNEIYDKEVLKGRLDEEFYNSIKKEEFILTSRYGYKLSGIILSNEETNKSVNLHKVAVLCHGYTYGKYGSVCYAKILMELGFTCVIYDHRNHGDSDKVYTSMGYYEKYDLQTVIDFCYEHFGEDIKVITHGESMGAATVLNHLEIDNRVTCTIADCPFSDLTSLLQYQLKRYYHLPAALFLPIANLIFKIRAGFFIKDVSPMNSVTNTKTPVLFIHGEDDMYVPASMSIEMYEKRSEAKDIFICEGAKHAQSCIIDPLKYFQSIIKFLDKYYA